MICMQPSSSASRTCLWVDVLLTQTIAVHFGCARSGASASNDQMSLSPASAREISGFKFSSCVRLGCRASICLTNNIYMLLWAKRSVDGGHNMPESHTFSALLATLLVKSGCHCISASCQGLGTKLSTNRGQQRATASPQSASWVWLPPPAGNSTRQAGHCTEWCCLELLLSHCHPAQSTLAMS